MNEFRDCLDIPLIHGNGRHALFSAAAADDGQHRFSLLVIQHERGTEQVGSTELTAAKVHTVACAAGDRVQRFAALDECRIARGALLRRKDGGPPAASLASAATLRILRLCRRRWRRLW